MNKCYDNHRITDEKQNKSKKIFKIRIVKSEKHKMEKEKIEKKNNHETV